MSPLSPARARLYIFLTALLWSTSGLFAKVLTQPTFLGMNEPAIETLEIGAYRVPVQIACYRVFFACLVLVPTLRPGNISWRPMMLASGLCFAAMNISFITAMALTQSANVILLQYSAPLWVYLISVLWLGETPDRRGTITTFLGTAGIGVIIAGGWQGGDVDVLGIALASGLCYACVLLCLRSLRTVDPSWLTFWNHFWSGAILVPLVIGLRPPTWQQFIVLFLYGGLQMGVAYWLAAKSLQALSPQEVATISLLEPILNPIWAYLVSPATEALGPWTLAGGAIIVATLAWRYWPFRA